MCSCVGLQVTWMTITKAFFDSFMSFGVPDGRKQTPPNTARRTAKVSDVPAVVILRMNSRKPASSDFSADAEASKLSSKNLQVV